MTTYDIKIKDKKTGLVGVSGRMVVDGLAGNCGYNLLRSYYISRGKVNFTKDEQKFINNSILNFFYTNEYLRNRRKIILTDRVRTGNQRVDSLRLHDFIEDNEGIVIGTEVTGNDYPHNYKTRSAEFDPYDTVESGNIPKYKESSTITVEIEQRGGW